MPHPRTPTVDYFADLLREREQVQLLRAGRLDISAVILEREISRVRHAVYDGSFARGGTLPLPMPKDVEAVIRQEIPVPCGPFMEGPLLPFFLLTLEHFMAKLSLFTGCTIKIIDHSHPKRGKPALVIGIRCLDAANRARVRLDIATEYIESYLERIRHH